MPYRPRLKICGVTTSTDAELVSASGADYCGILINVDFSERSISLRQAGEVASASRIPVVVLLCDPELEAAEKIVRQIRPHAIQLLCQESPETVSRLKARLSCRIWKSVHLPPPPDQAPPEAYVEAGADALLIDSADESGGFLRLGGTGKVADWQAAAAIVEKLSTPIFIAGGINQDNVEEALTRLRPYGVDLCSGVEAAVGEKDPEKVRALVSRFKAAVERIEKGEA